MDLKHDALRDRLDSLSLFVDLKHDALRDMLDFITTVCGSQV